MVNALPKPSTHIYRAFITMFFQLTVPEVSLRQPTSYYRRYGKVRQFPLFSKPLLGASSEWLLPQLRELVDFLTYRSTLCLMRCH
jgi:hypothetical protein